MYIVSLPFTICPLNVKKRSNKSLKNVKKRKKTWQKFKKKTFVNVIKNVTSSYSVVQLHAWCPRNGLQGNSEYAVQFSFAETVVVLG